LAASARQGGRAPVASTAVIDGDAHRLIEGHEGRGDGLRDAERRNPGLLPGNPIGCGPQSQRARRPWFRVLRVSLFHHVHQSRSVRRVPRHRFRSSDHASTGLGHRPSCSLRSVYCWSFPKEVRCVYYTLVVRLCLTPDALCHPGQRLLQGKPPLVPLLLAGNRP